MQFYFLPALGSNSGHWIPGGLLSEQYVGKPGRIANCPFPKSYHIANWMDTALRGTPAYYPHLLLSYYWHKSRALDFPEDSYVFGDSGGFTVLLKGMSQAPGPLRHQRWIDPTDVVRWQAEICDVGAILDKPPVTPEGKRNLKLWEEALATTLKNTNRALPTYQEVRATGSKFRWWGVVHGWSVPQLDRWWRAVSDIYPFTDEGEGWAIRARPTSFDPVAIGRCLYWLQTRGIQNAHFLAAAGSAAVATILVLGQQTGLQIASSDSKAALDFARNRKAFTSIKDGLAYGYVLEAGATREARDFFLQDCPCISCGQLREDVVHYPDIATCQYEGDFGNYWFHRFLFHNYLILIDIQRNLEREARSNGDAMLRAVLGTRYSTVLQAVEGQSNQSAQGFPTSLLDYV